MKATYVVDTGRGQHTVDVREVGDLFEITIDGTTHLVDAVHIAGSSVRTILWDRRSYEANIVQEGDRIDVYLEGDRYPVEVYDELWARAKAAAGDKKSQGEEIKAPIPGAVVKILVSPGESVSAGQPVAILEAMKMQNELTSANGGVVAEVKVAVGDTVTDGQLLIVLKPEVPAEEVKA